MEFLILTVLGGIFFFLPFLLIGGVCIGAFLPKEFRWEGTTQFHGSAQEAWMRICSFERYPDWLTPLKRVECVDAASQVWRFSGNVSSLQFQKESEENARSLRLRLLSIAQLPIEGTCSFTLEEPTPGETQVTLCAEGRFEHKLMRGYLWFFHRKKAPVAIYLQALAAV
jgi:hypothetical protein